jgi:hypothetical protein
LFTDDTTPFSAWSPKVGFRDSPMLFLWIPPINFHMPESVFMKLGMYEVRSRKARSTAMVIHCADHVTPSIHKSWH